MGMVEQHAHEDVGMARSPGCFSCWQQAPARVAPTAPLAKAAALQPLSENIVKAWKEAGAEVGWLRVHPADLEAGWLRIHTADSLEFVREKEGKPGDLPALRFPNWRSTDWQGGRLAKLPAPAPAFGLDIPWTQVMDAGLKEVLGLKSLQALSFHNSPVSDVPLRGQASLTLRALGLGQTPQVTDPGLPGFTWSPGKRTESPQEVMVTDARLKALAGLKNLQALDLGNNQVTDAGLKELAELKSLQWLNLGYNPR